MSEFYIGLMSGTSVDAIDAVLMDFSKSSTHIVTSLCLPIDTKLRDAINQTIGKNTWPQNVEKIDLQFSCKSIKVIEALLSQTSIQKDQITAIGSHGQTIWHDPNGQSPCSIQIGNVKHIADKTGITTIGNFRKADIDAGGQGAPLACAYHEEVLRNKNEDRVILNLGGIANITVLPAQPSIEIMGFDTGPANTLLDAWIKKHQNKEFDRNGAWAKTGKVNQELLDLMLSDEYFQSSPPKSTGREKFNLNWLQNILDQYEKTISEKDVQATLASLTIKSVTNAVKSWAPQTKRVLHCGGGSHNTYLVSQLKEKLREFLLEPTSAHGIPVDWMEAMAFAWLAKQKIEDKLGNIPSVTGARNKVVLGDLYKPS